MNIIRWFAILLSLLVVTPALAQSTTPPEELYRVNADGTSIQRVLSDPSTIYWGPNWSRKGSQIALTMMAVGSRGGDLYIANSDGSQPSQLTRNGRSNYFAVWSPTDQLIAFISQDSDKLDTAEIYTIRADGTQETRLTNNTAQEYGMSWSPDGSHIIFGSKQSGDWGIYTMNVDGSDLAPLAIFAHGNAPTWSPDGKQIAFTSDRDGDDDIYVANIDGSDQRNITNNTAWDDQPTWSPDGSRIAFASDRDGLSRVYTTGLNDQVVRSITSGLELAAGFPVWSPDSQQILFHARELTADERTNNLPLVIGAVATALGIVAVSFIIYRRRLNRVKPNI